ncbi:hypothetical protein GYMLUDRAFT_83051, partial [Collybiopsis luxurians FD-317 M1]
MASYNNSPSVLQNYIEARGVSAKSPPPTGTSREATAVSASESSLHSTPHSQHGSSQRDELAQGAWNRVEEANKALKIDIATTKTLSVPDFASIVFNVDVEHIPENPMQEIQPDVQQALDAYLELSQSDRKSTNRERRLYEPLADLLNRIHKGSSEGTTFYVQDAVYVRGSTEQRIPDIGGLEPQLVGGRDMRVLLGEKMPAKKNRGNSTKNKEVTGSGRVFWGLIKYLFEVKARLGKTLGAEYTIPTEKKPEPALKSVRKRSTTGGDGPSTKRAKGDTSGGNTPESRMDSGTSSYLHVPSSTPADSSEIRRDQDVMDQVAGYASDMLCNGVFRSHAIIVVVDDAIVRFIFYDHSAIVQSETLFLYESEAQWRFVRMVERLHVLRPVENGIIQG